MCAIISHSLEKGSRESRLEGKGQRTRYSMKGIPADSKCEDIAILCTLCPFNELRILLCVYNGKFSMRVDLVYCAPIRLFGRCVRTIEKEWRVRGYLYR